MKKRKIQASFTRHWRRQSYIMVAPALLIVLVFMVLPFIMNIRYAFTDYSMQSTNVHFTGFTNFKNVFSDRSFQLVVMNTVKLTLTYMLVINAFALILAILISKVRTRFGNAVKTVVYFPQLLSMVVVGFLWRIMLSYKHGPVNALLVLLGVSEKSVPQWLGTPALIIPSIAVACIWLVSGYYTIVYYAGIMSIPNEYYEVSMLDGASRWQEFIYVTLPCLKPSIKINTVLLTIESLSVFAVPAAMTDGGGPGTYGTTFALWAYNTYFGKMQYGKAIAMSVMIGVVAIIMALVEMFVLKKKEDI